MVLHNLRKSTKRVSEATEHFTAGHLLRRLGPRELAAPQPIPIRRHTFSYDFERAKHTRSPRDVDPFLRQQFDDSKNRNRP